MISRIEITPRENWQAIVEAFGFNFHSQDGGYWDESACYVFNHRMVEKIQSISLELHQMFLEAAEYVIRHEIYARFGMPEYFIQAVEQSWSRGDPDLYGRFDFSLDQRDGQLKLLEYNADTPETLIETGQVQKQWHQNCFADTGQYNLLEDALILRWKQLKNNHGLPHHVNFMSVTEFPESMANIRYMAQTAEKAGISTTIQSAYDFVWDNARNCYCREDGKIIKAIFKIYPWEWMLPLTVGMANEPCPLFALEPCWKFLLSNKVMLAFMWKLFPEHPNLLPTFFIPEAFKENLIKKATLSRNSEDVFHCTDAEQSYHFGDNQHDYIYQKTCQIQSFSNHYYPVFGSWIVGGKPCGLGIREDTRFISSNLNRFVPHIVR